MEIAAENFYEQRKNFKLQSDAAPDRFWVAHRFLGLSDTIQSTISNIRRRNRTHIYIAITNTWSNAIWPQLRIKWMQVSIFNSFSLHAFFYLRSFWTELKQKKKIRSNFPIWLILSAICTETWWTAIKNNKKKSDCRLHRNALAINFGLATRIWIADIEIASELKSERVRVIGLNKLCKELHTAHEYIFMMIND